MSEEHLGRIERAIAELRVEVATELAELRAEMATKTDLAELATRIAELRAGTAGNIADLRGEMATKSDLAGVARNVDVEALARLARQSLTETAAVHDELRVVSALAQQLVGAVSGLTNLFQASR